MRDKDVRAALRSHLTAKYGGDSETLLVEELGLCQGASRIDVALINGTLNGFEIKSARDTLERLPDQERIYSRIFDTVTLVTADDHLREVEQFIPEWWGIQEAYVRENGVGLRWYREGNANPAVDPRSLIELVWRDEALEALAQRGLAHGLKSKPRRQLWDALVENFTVIEISRLVRTTLRAREGWSSGPRLRLSDV